MQKIKVFHIITKLELGGAQQNTLFTVEHLNRTEFDVGLITNDKGELINESKKIPNLKTYYIPQFVREVSILKDLRTLYQLFKILKKEKPYIIHTHSSKAGILGRLAGKLSGVPIIIHSIHGFGFTPLQNSLARNFFITLERLTTTITTHFIAVSEANIELGLKLGIIKNRNDVTLIRSGIDIAEFSNVKVDVKKKKSEIGILEDESVVGMVACFKPQKDVLTFISSAKIVSDSIPNVKFVIAGDGEERKKIERFIKELDLEEKVILLGWRRDIPELMKIFDVFVLTSLWEGLPRVFLQAMASELPIVATSVDGAPEVVKDGINGFLLKPKDSKGIAEKVIYLLKNKNTAKEMGKKGASFLYDEFDIHKMVNKQEELYKKLIAKTNKYVKR